MRYLFILIFGLFQLHGFAQSSGNPTQEKQKDVLEVSSSLNKIKQSQAEQLAFRFLNNYTTTERNKSLSSQERTSALSKISEDASRMIAGSWQFYLIKFLQANKRDLNSLQMALASGNKMIVLPYAVQFAIIQEDEALLKTYTAELDHLVPIERNAFVYHYNTLMSANADATIYARGILDLVPLAILQQQHNIRKDIHLKYYEGDIQERENAYLCLSIGKEILIKYPDASYTGLLIKIKSANTINEMEKHIFSDFDLSNFTNDNLGFSNEVPNKNYLPALHILYKFYQQNQKDTKPVFKLIEKIKLFYGIKD